MYSCCHAAVLVVVLRLTTFTLQFVSFIHCKFLDDNDGFREPRRDHQQNVCHGVLLFKYSRSVVVNNYLKSPIYVSSVKKIAPSSEEPRTAKALHQHSKGLLAGLNALWNLVRWVACGSRNAVPWICPLELLMPSL
jgi:hypothetical protein